MSQSEYTPYKDALTSAILNKKFVNEELLKYI